MMVGEVIVEYQPRIDFVRDRLNVYNLDGQVEMSLLRGLSIADVSHDTWRRCAVLNVDLMDDIYMLDAQDHLQVIKRIRDMMFFYVALGFGEPAQQVADWFLIPSQCAWVQDVPIVLNSPSIGLGPLEVTDMRGMIDGRVSFTIALSDDEVDFTLTWDKFLLGASIDVKEAAGEIY